MIPHVKSIVEVKPRAWFKPSIILVERAFNLHLINAETAERMLNKLISNAFRYRTDKGKWLNLSVDTRVEVS